MDNNTQAFLALVRAGLWEKEAVLMPYGEVNYDKIMHLAEEQSVMGLVTAGLEHVRDVTVPKEILLQFIGQALQLEQRNQSMNEFVGSLWEWLVSVGLNAILVKGQGVAQCYEKPLWRESGDIDLLFEQSQYEKAKVEFNKQLLQDSKEKESTLEYCLTIDNWTVELHGTLHTRLTKRIDACVDEVQKKCFEENQIRVWEYKEQKIALPSVDNDVILVFTHIIKHMFHGGIGLRQVCDWCRLLYRYKDEIDYVLLEKRLRDMKLIALWNNYAVMAASYLGTPQEAIPLINVTSKSCNKAKRLISFIMDVGNFGHNRDKGYKSKHSFIVRQAISLWLNTKDYAKLFMIIPSYALREWGRTIVLGYTAAIKDIKLKR